MVTVDPRVLRNHLNLLRKIGPRIYENLCVKYLPQMLDQLEVLYVNNKALRDANDNLRKEIDDLRKEVDNFNDRLSEFEGGDIENQDFIASPRRSTFHTSSCRWMEPVWDPIRFTSHDDAVEQGYKPCKTCRA